MIPVPLTTQAFDTPTNRPSALPLLIAVVLMALAMVGCGDDDSSAEPEMTMEPMIELQLTSHYEGPFEMDGMTVEFSTAILGLQEIAVFAAADHQEMSYKHNYGGGHGAPAMTTLPQPVDLTSPPVSLGMQMQDQPGHYSNVVVSLAPAGTGPAMGYTLLLEGTATQQGASRPFRVEWIANEIPFLELTDLHFHHDGESHNVFLLGLHHDEILRGVDLMNLGKSSEMLLINRTNHPDVIRLIEDNIANDFHAHDDDHNHEGHQH